MIKFASVLLMSIFVGWLFRQTTGTNEVPEKKEHASTISPIKTKTYSPPAILTNILEPSTTWIRLEVSYRFENSILQTEMEKISDDLIQDTVVFLRTLKLSSLEGPLGLIHLREDLLSRAIVRMQGKSIDILIKTMVLQ